MKNLKACLLLSMAALAMSTLAQTPSMRPRKWVSEQRSYTQEFLKSDDAREIASRVMHYQQKSGGWPKNIRYQETDERLRFNKNELKYPDESTIDNGATTSEIEFLSKMYGATGKKAYRKAALRGIEYILKAQYDNGGWPQYYPRTDAYHAAITYNDDAMLNVLKLIERIAKGEAPFAYVGGDVRERCRKAFDKGIECIINTQYVQNGVPTAWCAQHDQHTLQPCKARAFELASLSGSESASLLMFLMTIDNPSDKLIQCIDHAAEWFRKVRITGLGFERFTDQQGRRDYRMVSKKGAPDLWARFYTLDGNRPFFSDRDGVMKFDISEIGHERRNGYSWYNTSGTKLLKMYDKWQKRQKERKNM